MIPNTNFQYTGRIQHHTLRGRFANSPERPNLRREWYKRGAITRDSGNKDILSAIPVAVYYNDDVTRLSGSEIVAFLLSQVCVYSPGILWAPRNTFLGYFGGLLL